MMNVLIDIKYAINIAADNIFKLILGFFGILLANTLTSWPIMAVIFQKWHYPAGTYWYMGLPLTLLIWLPLALINMLPPYYPGIDK